MMLFYLKLAFKNLGRHGKRTLIAAAAIAMGLATFLLLDSMLQGADRLSEDNLIRHETGGFRIYSPEGADKKDMLSLRYPLDNAAAVQSALAAKGITSTRRLSFQAELALTDPRFGTASSTVVRAIAVNPDEDARVFPVRAADLEGRWFKHDEYGMVLGRWLAEDRGVKTGDMLTISCRTREGSFQVLDFMVTGIFDSPNPNLNRSGVFIPLDLADRELAMAGGVTELVIPMEPGLEVANRAKELQGLVDGLGFKAKVLSWKDLAADYLAISGTKKKGTSSILFLVFVIAAVGISNTLLMAFYERKTEIGMLRALGMDDRTLFWTFIAEAAGIGLIGSMMGLVLGAAAVLWLVQVGIDFSFITRSMDIGYRIAGTFHGVWEPKSFGTALILGTGLSAFVAIFPTRRALKLPLTESLRSE